MEANKENNVAVAVAIAASAPAPAPAPPAAAVGEAVDSSSSSSLGYSQKRKRFRIDLVPGETTIVSWKKLLSEGKYEIEEPCAPVEMTEPAVSRLKQDPETRDDQDELLQIEESRTKHSDKSVHLERDNIEHINEASKSANCRPKKRRKDKAEAPREKEYVHHQTTTNHKTLQHVKTKAASRYAPPPSPCVDEKYFIQSEGLNVKSNQNIDEKPHYSFHASVGFSIEKPCDPSIRFECSSVAITVNQCSSGLPLEASKSEVCMYSMNTENNVKVPSDKRRSVSEKEHSTSVRDRDKNNSRNKLPDLNLPYPGSSQTYGSLHAKDASSGRQKGTVPDRSILESEKIIAKFQ